MDTPFVFLMLLLLKFKKKHPIIEKFLENHFLDQ